MDAHGDASGFRSRDGSIWTNFAWSAGLSLFFAAHGMAHLVGTSRSFQAVSDGESLDYLGGAWTISDPTMLRLVGVAWAVVAVAYMAAATGEWLGWRGWLRFAAGVTVFSLVLSLIALWGAWIGVVIDVVILATAGWWLRAHPDEA